MTDVSAPDPGTIQLALQLTATIAAYLALQHLWLWLWLGRRREQLHWLVAAFAMNASVFAGAQAAPHDQLDRQIGLNLIRISAVSAVLVGGLFIATTCTIAQISWPRWNIRCLVAAHGLAAVLMLCTPLWIGDDGAETKWVLVLIPYLV